MNKTVPQIYRDCLRLVEHIAGRSKKADVMKALLKAEFLKNKDVTEADKIEKLKDQYAHSFACLYIFDRAKFGLVNYLTLQNIKQLKRDPATLRKGPAKKKSATTVASQPPR